MDKMTNRTGLWAAIISLLSILVWFFSFGIIAAQGPLFFWTTPQDYYLYATGHNLFFHELAKAFMLVFSLSFFVLHFSLFESRKAGQGFMGRVGLSFLGMFALLSSIHYFWQLSTVRLNLARGTTNGLEHFLQANPTSASLALNMLGWTLLLGLSSFFFIFFFKKADGQRWLRIFHILNAVFCLLALIGFLWPYDPLTFVSINTGVGGAITLISIWGLRYFLRLLKAG